MTEPTADAPDHGSWAPLVDAIAMVGHKYRVALEALVTLRQFHPSGEVAMDEAVETIGFLSSIAGVLRDWLRTAEEESPDSVEERADGPDHEAVDLVFEALLGTVPEYPVAWVAEPRSE